jgi:hypothetical protein
MTFRNNPTLTGTPTGTPVGSVAVPGHANGDLTALRGANASTDGNGNETAAVAAVIENATPLGQSTMGSSSPVVIASDQSTIPIESMIQKAIRTGTAWSATTGKVNSGAALNSVPFSFFLPSSSTKNVYIYSLEFLCGATVNADLRLTTTDPAWGTALTPINDKSGGGAIGSTLTITTTNTAQTVAGTPWRAPSALANVLCEVFPTNLGRLLSAGVAGGIELWMNISSTQTYAVTVRWIEY